MQKIFLLSDTHADWNDAWIKYINEADEIWHAGDIGNENFIHHLLSISKSKPLRIVYGNIDNQNIRHIAKKYVYFELEGFKILMLHIAGAFQKYNVFTKQLIQNHHPDILVCGHSHILKIQFDTQYNLWYINPGAAGKYGFHKIKTALSFELEQKSIRNMKIIEWQKM